MFVHQIAGQADADHTQLSATQADLSWASLLPAFPTNQPLPFLLLASAPQIKEAMRVTPIIAGFPRVALQASHSNCWAELSGDEIAAAGLSLSGSCSELCSLLVAAPSTANCAAPSTAHPDDITPSPSRSAGQDFELCGHLVPKGTRMQCSLQQPLLTDERCVGRAGGAPLLAQGQGAT